MKTIVKTGLLLCSFAFCGTAFSQEQPAKVTRNPKAHQHAVAVHKATTDKKPQSKTQPLTRAEAVPNKQKF